MAKFCGECGKELREGASFCAECGTPAPKAVPTVSQDRAEPMPVQQEPVVQQQPAVQQQQKAPAQAETNTVGTGMYFLLMFLYALPGIGLIACIISAFAPSNKNIRNFAKAMLIWLVIGVVFTVIIVIAGSLLGGVVTEYLAETDMQSFGEFGEAISELSQLKDGLGQLGEYEELAEQLQNGTLEELTSMPLV